MNPQEESTTAIFCMTLYGEARSEDREGITLVGMTILHRALSPITWWGRGLKSVCLTPKQFSCWNDPFHANYKAMLSAWENRASDASMEQIMHIADGILLGKTIRTAVDKSINHYHTIDVNPSWSHGVLPIIVHKRHKFYSL